MGKNVKRRSIINIFNKSILLNLSILFLLSLFVISTVLIVRRHQQTYMHEVYEKQILKELIVKMKFLQSYFDSPNNLRAALDDFNNHYSKYYSKVISEDDLEKQNRLKMLDLEVFVIMEDVTKIMQFKSEESSNLSVSLYIDRFDSRFEIIKDLVHEEIRLLEIIIPLKHYRLTQIQNLSIAIFVFLLIIVSIFILLNRKVLLRNISDPLTKLEDAMENIGKGDFNYKIEDIHNNELGDLCNTMNSLTKKILKSHKLLTESHRMASIGVMASGIAHELSQPLGVILLKSQLVSVLMDRGEYDKIKKEYKGIEVQVLRAKKIIDSLRIISREGKEEEKSLEDIDQLVSEVITLFIDEFRYAGIELNLNLSNQKLLIYSTHVQICQAISNIISNARDAVKNVKNPAITITSFKEDNKVVLSISDNGNGIPEKHIKRIFEPFYTLKDVGKGTGLGLSLSQSMLNSNNGVIEVKSTEGRGAEFRLIFPCGDGETYE